MNKPILMVPIKPGEASALADALQAYVTHTIR
jgi:hypothetical protein